MDVFGYGTPTARKEHKCDLCRGTIDKGEIYERWAFSDGGICQDIKVHTHCNVVLEKYLGRETEFDWFGVEDYIQDMCIEHNLCDKGTPMPEKVILVYGWLKENRDENTL